MIGTSLQIMLFGMLGIFIVMGLIGGTITLLNSFDKSDQKSDQAA